MKIAQITPRYYPFIGGVETYVKEISERLNRKGIEIEIFTTDSTGELPKEEMVNGIQVNRFDAYSPGNAYTFSSQLYNHLKENSYKYDILHAHQYHALPSLYAKLSKKNNNKLIFNTYYHGKGHTFLRNLLHKPYKIIGKQIINSSDKIVCISEHEKKLLLNNFNIEDNKVTIIPCGINLSDFIVNKKEEKNTLNILTVSRIEKYKGIHHLIEIMPSMDKEIKLNIVGRGPYKKNIIRLAKNNGSFDSINFYENVPRETLIQLYINADLFVLLSQYESYGIVVGEALASGTPCIVADTSALSEWVDNENCYGIKYPIKLPELLDLVNKTIGKNVKKQDLITWDQTANKFKELFELVVKQ